MVRTTQPFLLESLPSSPLREAIQKLRDEYKWNKKKKHLCRLIWWEKAFPQRGISNLSQDFHQSRWVHCTRAAFRWVIAIRPSQIVQKKKRGRQTSRKMYSEIIYGKLASRLRLYWACNSRRWFEFFFYEDKNISTEKIYSSHAFFSPDSSFSWNQLIKELLINSHCLFCANRVLVINRTQLSRSDNNMIMATISDFYGLHMCHKQLRVVLINDYSRYRKAFSHKASFRLSDLQHVISSIGE